MIKSISGKCLVTSLLVHICFFLSAQIGGAGGITISISPDVDISDISSFMVEGDRLILETSKGEYSIEVPTGVMRHIFDMASNDIDEPIIFSQDNFFFGTGEDGFYYKQRERIEKVLELNEGTFSPFSNLENDYLLLLFYYDIYVHCLICEALQNDSIDHPYYQKDKTSPREEVETYLRTQDPNIEESSNYWQIIKQYTNPPTCIGTVNFFIEPSTEGLPIQLSVKTSKFFVVQNWESDITVLPDGKSKIAELPYLALAEDIETNWSEYRSHFKDIDQLSSIVEAYSIVKLFREKNSLLFEQIKEKAGLAPIQLPELGKKYVVSPILNEGVWIEYSKSMIGTNIDDLQEAKMELSIFMAEKGLSENITMDELKYKELAEISSLDSNFQLLLLLFKAINEVQPDTLSVYQNYFENVRSRSNDIEKLRLWAMGIKWLRVNIELDSRYKVEQNKNPYSNLLEEQQIALITDFNAYLEYNLDSLQIPLESINELVALIYESGIVSIAKQAFSKDRYDGIYYNSTFTELLNAVSDTHYRAAIELEPDEAEVIHFHFRFITYLQNLIPQLKKEQEELDKRLEKILVMLRD